ncbi:MAG: extracellular solute-binding protein [Alphaproteobacteria bacterium]|nr:extracellular solute-binding protein [Alphaproteobacteria bacterium]
MKKYLVFILFLGALCAFLFPKFKLNQDTNPSYKTLTKESLAPFDNEKRLYIIVGIDYIPYELIQEFEKISGIKVIVDVFDSNEILEAKLLAGSVQYDLVFPTAWPNFSRQLKAGIYQKLDKTKIDMSAFDKDILTRLAEYDTNNEYALPYQFGIAGIGIDEKIVDELIPNAPKNSLALLLDPKFAEKLSKYHISMYESPNEIFPALLAYLGLNPETESEEDIIKAAEHLKKIRPYISKFTSFGFEDLASGNACATLSTSGDILRVQKYNNKPNIKFFRPKEGASLWVDIVAIPKGAQHINNIYAFLKFIFTPEIIAQVTNQTYRANAVTNSAKYVAKELINDENIYPSADVRRKCYIEKPLPPNIEALKTRLLTKIKSAGA